MRMTKIMKQCLVMNKWHNIYILIHVQYYNTINVIGECKPDGDHLNNVNRRLMDPVLDNCVDWYHMWSNPPWWGKFGIGWRYCITWSPRERQLDLQGIKVDVCWSIRKVTGVAIVELDNWGGLANNTCRAPGCCTCWYSIQIKCAHQTYYFSWVHWRRFLLSWKTTEQSSNPGDDVERHMLRVSLIK